MIKYIFIAFLITMVVENSLQHDWESSDMKQEDIPPEQMDKASDMKQEDIPPEQMDKAGSPLLTAVLVLECQQESQSLPTSTSIGPRCPKGKPHSKTDASSSGEVATRQASMGKDVQHTPA
ncbi:unnamed protein product [Leptidea sinapis]|uniref:Uncharacterized protein n=1 Tax=Leptidea sinapis TaxID=189913 RepID=A0A5E4QVX3_9NEOP|nr:unnamed protein product [Leptidea sinapis]